LKFAFEANTRGLLSEEDAMRKLTGAAVAMIMVVALYFALFWGFDGLRILTSPNYGLEDVWRSQFVFSIGSHFGLGPVGLIKLAAFFGALKLAVAGICAVHLFDRLRSLMSGKADNDILEGGLILVVAISILSVGPAIASQNGELVREQVVQLLLAAIATALCLLERNYERPATAPKPEVSMELTATPRGAPWYSPFR
jgi:hypothetical protein